jgi:ABC-type dipeptide/oligopeptide/nickel transport system permease subunit
LFSDAAADLVRNPLFLLAALLIVVLVLMAAFPSLFTSKDPSSCSLSRSLRPPSSAAWFGYDLQGCDVFARTVYGARASIMVGIFSTLLAGVISVAVGTCAGYYGGWVDAALSRVIDIVFGVPLLLGAVVLLRSLADRGLGIWPVVLTLGVLGWTSSARIMRSSVISTKHADYVLAARALGANDRRIVFRHILPNSLGPVIVVLTITLGVFIATEATLSFLGLGPQGVISWGVDIAAAQKRVREAAHPLLFPSAFLTVTVLAFVMLGDAVRDAFDPKLR